MAEKPIKRQRRAVVTNPEFGRFAPAPTVRDESVLSDFAVQMILSEGTYGHVLQTVT